MGVSESGGGNQGAGAEEIPGGGNVVAGFIPVIGQAEQGQVGQVERREDDREDHPQRERRVGAWHQPGEQGRIDAFWLRHRSI